MRKTLIFLSILICNSIFSQSLHNAQWVIGYDTSLLDNVGNAILLDFNNNELAVSAINPPDNNFWSGEGATSISDTNGELLFYSNNCDIINREHELMLNGDTLALGTLEENYCSQVGTPMPQGSIALPIPEKENQFIVFNLDQEYPYFLYNDTVSAFAPINLYYHLIDMNEDNGLGAVIAKHQHAIQDTLARGNVQAVKHGNGIDWWVITPESHSNCYYLNLVTKNGVAPPIKKCAGIPWGDKDWNAQAVFSPDGSKYIRFNRWNGLHIYDFDRCTGDLTNPLKININDHEYFAGGAAISPNSRYLYICAAIKIYQFDLWAGDIASSRIEVADWDGDSNPIPVIFSQATLAIDDKIYIGGVSRHLNLHVIHNPNEKGLACEVEQYGVELPSYNFASMPNLPHYAPPLENLCDTTSSTEYTDFKSFATISPNPATTYLSIQSTVLDLEYQLVNVLGQTIQYGKVYEEQIDVSNLVSGVYYLVLKDRNSSQRLVEKIIIE